jgi:hypothetical protein
MKLLSLSQVGLAAVLVFLIGASAGCRTSSKPRGAGFAAVDIPSRSTAEVLSMTVIVFTEHGFDLASNPSRELVFEKEGSRGEVVTYGSWFDKKVWVRVRVSIEAAPSATPATRLECEAWMVRDRGERRFEEEQKLSRLRSRPYQDLLEEIARRVEQQ